MDREIALSVQQKEKRETSLNGLFLSRNLTGDIMTTENERNSKLVSELAQFSGTTQYYRFSPQLFPYFLLTDGTHYLAEEAGCYWLFELIASLQTHASVRKLQQIQFWTLNVAEDNSAVLICEWDTGQVIYSQQIEFTDFPLDSVRIWVTPTEMDFRGVVRRHWVAMLPSEY
jgi:hypothetical protein